MDHTGNSLLIWKLQEEIWEIVLTLWFSHYLEMERIVRKSSLVNIFACESNKSWHWAHTLDTSQKYCMIYKTFFFRFTCSCQCGFTLGWINKWFCCRQNCSFFSSSSSHLQPYETFYPPDDDRLQQIVQKWDTHLGAKTWHYQEVSHWEISCVDSNLNLLPKDVRPRVKFPGKGKWHRKCRNGSCSNAHMKEK